MKTVESGKNLQSVRVINHTLNNRGLGPTPPRIGRSVVEMPTPTAGQRRQTVDKTGRNCPQMQYIIHVLD